MMFSIYTLLRLIKEPGRYKRLAKSLGRGYSFSIISTQGIVYPRYMNSRATSWLPTEAVMFSDLSFGHCVD